MRALREAGHPVTSMAPMKSHRINMRRNSPGIKIRAATLDDASSIASVLSESFAEYELSYTQEAFTATTPTSDQIQSRLDEGPVWVALHNDAIVGTVSEI